MAETQQYTIYKGDINSQPFSLNPNATLKDVRKLLGDYVTNDFRFVNYQNKQPVFSDMILSLSSEEFAPVHSVAGLKKQLYLTDVTKKKKTDLVGFNTDWFFDRYMSCRVTLNPEGPAKATNSGKMPPLMLTNVKTANPDIKGFGVMENVVICEKDSIIQFGLSSWGAIGYGYDIRSEAGTPVTGSPLYISFSQCTANNYANTVLQKYYSQTDKSVNGKMIQIVPISKMNVGDKTLQYMKFSIKTWIVTEYKTASNDKKTCNQSIPHSQVSFAVDETDFVSPPYSLLAGASNQVVVPGDTISPGTTVPAKDQSSQNFGGPIHDIVENKNPNGIIGEVTFYVFVFNSHAEAAAVFSAVNDIDPNVWKN